MGAPEGEGGGGGDESSSIAHMLRHPSARQCYFEMKTNKEHYFSILSSIILWSDQKLRAFEALKCSVDPVKGLDTACNVIVAESLR